MFASLKFFLARMNRACVSPHLTCCSLIFSLILLSGCARFKPEPISPETTADNFDSRSLTNENLRAFLQTNHVIAEWPCRTWDLNTLTCAAFYYQPALAEARAQLASTQASEVTAGQRPNPTLSVSPTYDTTTSPPWIPGVSLDIPLETAGKRSKRIAQAKSLSEAARWDFIAAAWQTRSHVRAALLSLYTARENERLLAKQEFAQSNVVHLTQGQFNAGVASSSDLAQARVVADTVRLSREDAIGQTKTSQVQLASAIGLPARALDEAQFDFSELEKLPDNLTKPEVRRTAVLNRTDIRSALAQYAASQSALQLEIAKQYPDVHLNPGYELDQTDNKWTLGLSVDLPVLNQNQGPIAEATAKRKQAAAHFLSVQANAISEIDVALAVYGVALKKLELAKALQSDLQRQFDSVRAQADAGEVDALSLANAQATYYTGAQNHLDALIKAQEALGALEDAMQSPLTLPADSLHAAQNDSPAHQK